jgi:acyl-CoA synthetase (AMP-forming)/AMP-acid ligase II
MSQNNVNCDLGIEETESHLSETRSLTLSRLLEKNARIHGDEVAVVGEDGEELTYSQLDDSVNRLARGLSERGFGYGDTIAVLSENRREFVELYYAGSRLGAPVAAQNWRLEKSELLHCLNVVDADIVFVSEQNSEKIEWIEAADTISSEIVGLDSGIASTCYTDVMSDEAERYDSPADSEDIAAILYTSGTTGLPKGAAISNRAFIARGMARHVMGLHTKDQPDNIAWLPMFHMASADFVATVALQGGTYYPIDGFKPGVVLDTLERSETRLLLIVPATVQELLDYVHEEDIDIPASDIDLGYIGSQPDLVAPNKITELSETFDAKFLNSFGATETGFAPATGNHFAPGEKLDPEMWKEESPVCEARLVDESWETVPQGEVGEMAMRGPTLFSGYIGNQQANEEDFEEGWFRMGDMFQRNDEGQVRFIDRRKYLIKSGGENIYPAEIEKPLMDHKDINEAICVRVTDEKWGEVPKVYVSLEPDAEFNTGDILDLLDGRVARYKHPHYVEFVDQSNFPRSTSGKIKRTTVEEWPVTDDQRVRSP